MGTKKDERYAECVFIMPDGTTVSNPSPDVAGLAIKFADGEEPFQVTPQSFGDHAQAIFKTAAWHGLKAKLQDAYAGVRKSANPGASLAEIAALARESSVAIFERMAQLGEWNRAGTGAGPAVTMLISAIVERYAEEGQTLEPDAVRGYLQNEEWRNAAESDLRVKAILARMAAERAAARAQKLAAQVQSSEATPLPGLPPVPAETPTEQPVAAQ